MKDGRKELVGEKEEELVEEERNKCRSNSEKRKLLCVLKTRK